MRNMEWVNTSMCCAANQWRVFTFDKAGWDPSEGTEIDVDLVVLGPPGFARALSVNMTVAGYTAGDDAGADGGTGSDSDSCNCSTVGTTDSQDGLLALVFSAILS